MTPREAAEKRVLERTIDFFASIAMQEAGDAAEMKEAFGQAAKEIGDLKAELAAARAMIPDIPAP
jgi:hypothetical protein